MCVKPLHLKVDAGITTAECAVKPLIIDAAIGSEKKKKNQLCVCANGGFFIIV